MTALLKMLCVIVSVVGVSSMATAQQTPILAKERIVFSTEYGDLVFALYPQVAPSHVEQLMRLTKLNAYDSTHIYRVIPGFVIQFSDIKNRTLPLSKAQGEAEKTLKAEIDPKLKHVAGKLSMARWNDLNSATSSFSIILDASPHLDGKYTIFGELESGATVIKRFLGVPRVGETPKKRISITGSRIVSDINSYYAQYPRDPIGSMTLSLWEKSAQTAVTVAPVEKDVTPAVQPNTIENTVQVEEKGGQSVTPNLPAETSTPTMAVEKSLAQQWVLYVIAAMVLLSLMSFFLYDRLSKKHLLSFHMLNVLSGSFLLVAALIPVGHTQPLVAGFVFIGMVLLFKFMNRFESK